jgi:hypothetical protein
MTKTHRTREIIRGGDLYASATCITSASMLQFATPKIEDGRSSRQWEEPEEQKLPLLLSASAEGVRRRFSASNNTKQEGTRRIGQYVRDRGPAY